MVNGIEARYANGSDVGDDDFYPEEFENDNIDITVTLRGAKYLIFGGKAVFTKGKNKTRKWQLVGVTECDHIDGDEPAKPIKNIEKLVMRISRNNEEVQKQLEYWAEWHQDEDYQRAFDDGYVKEYQDSYY